MKRRTQIALPLVVLLLGAGLSAVFWPAPIQVDTVLVQKGDLEQVIEEEGRTRMHDRFLIAATVSGKLRRIDLDAGDVVRAGQTLGWIDPAEIDPRQKAVLEAKLNVAHSAKQQSDALVGRAKAVLAQTEVELERNQELYKQGIVSRQVFERASTMRDAAAKQLEAEEAAAQSSAHQIAEAQSALLVSQQDRSDLPTAVISPIEGHVLRVLEQSERTVGLGTPLIEIGYAPRLEIVADFLTRDAVRIAPGMSAIITDWGGDVAIPARVRLIEPGAFTKTSALGVEEQRVNVVCDFIGDTHGLQDGYHTEVRVTIWKGNNVLRVPASSLFRSSENWSVFIVTAGRVKKTAVAVGHRGDNHWEVIDGLNPGDHVVVHPSAEVFDGARVKEALRD